MTLDPRLEADSTYITDLELCQVRLNHNAAFPWVLLIPNKSNIVEIIDLIPTDQQILMQEIAKTSHVMRNLFNPIKINVANLGNIVPQLHIHIIARYQTDSAWPGPVWNSGKHEDYEPSHLQTTLEKIKQAFLNL